MHNTKYQGNQPAKTIHHLAVRIGTTLYKERWILHEDIKKAHC